MSGLFILKLFSRKCLDCRNSQEVTRLFKLLLDTLYFCHIYEAMEPLFSNTELFELLSAFSLTIFSTSEPPPLKWYCWLITECDSRREFEMISKVAPFVNDFVTDDIVKDFSLTSFNSETLHILSSNITENYLTIHVINSLTELWTASKLSVEEFSTILLSLKLTNANYQEIFSAFGRMLLDQELRPILFDFLYCEFVPKLISNSVTEKKLLEHQMSQQQQEINVLKTNYKKLSAIVQLVVNKMREDHDARRRHELIVSEWEQNRPLFRVTNKSPNISLTANSTVATLGSNSGSLNYCFVGIKHRERALVLDHNTVRFTSQSHSNGSFAKDDQVIIEFCNQKVVFSVPSSNYSHSITRPADHLFGIVMNYRNTSWQLSQDPHPPYVPPPSSLGDALMDVACDGISAFDCNYDHDY
ncbi:hypothetical protein RCL1_001409 [Eukaryota sp. TZLM3-RCL]